MTPPEKSDFEATASLPFAATIAPTVECAPGWTIDTLEQLRSSTLPEAPAAGVELGPVLGEGGMGIVRSATQKSLGRGVAVKTLRDGHTHDLAISKLLREALITGSLEHPNIVPVYDLGLDAAGTPMLVLKRISGVAWRVLLADPELVKQRFGAADPLEWHLRTLMQVCSAVHFAHRRGIVHRDIKPDNVMVGEFGEVYVLDWGISVALTNDGTHRFPLASESTELSGTPLYMAPEMFGGDPADERTDVYLLGATLYEIASGKPPHRGDSMVQIMASVTEPPNSPEGAPTELASIWLEAMAYERKDRFSSAEELRLALQGFLDHRGSTRLAALASTSLTELERHLEEPDAQGTERRVTIYNLFGECTFGFRQALDEWPENQVARDGLREATLRMARFEIQHEDSRAARLLLSRLEPPDPSLEAEVASLEKSALRSAERLKALERLGSEMDPNAGRRGRATLLVVLGALWVVVPFVAGRFYAPSPDYGTLVPIPAAMLGVVAVGSLVVRRSMMRTALNRSIVGAAALAFFAQMAVHVGSWLANVPPDESQRFILFIWFLIAAMMAIAVTPRLAFAAVAYLLAYFAASRWFAYRYELMAASNAVLFGTVLVTFVGKKDPESKGASASPPG